MRALTLDTALLSQQFADKDHILAEGKMGAASNTGTDTLSKMHAYYIV
jgi:hypothetical protein